MAYGGIIDVFLGIMQPLFPYTFDPLLTPLLSVGGLLTGARLTIVVVSVFLSAVLSLLYYLLMDVERYQELKDERQALNEKMQAAKDDGDTEQANKHMKEMASLQKEFFTLMLKPMLASMVLFFVLLPWMYSTFTPVVTLAAADGTYTGDLAINGHTVPVTLRDRNSSTVTVAGTELAQGDTTTLDTLPLKLKQVRVNDGEATAKFAAEIVPLPITLPFLQDELGWLGTYILVSIPFTYLFRKKLGVQ